MANTAGSLEKRRRNRLVAFIGATIVLGTFLVKDEKRDTIKDDLAGLTSAENVFLIRSENRDVPARLIKLEHEVRTRGEMPPSKAEDKRLWKARGTLLFVIEASNQWLPTVLADIDNIDRLVKPLGPLPTELQKKIQTLKDQSEQLKALTTPQTESIWDDPKALTSLASQIDDESTDLWDELNAARKEFLGYADRIKTEKEKSLKCWTWGSNILFVLGWIVGLVAKLSGDEKDEDNLPG